MTSSENGGNAQLAMVYHISYHMFGITEENSKPYT